MRSYNLFNSTQTIILIKPFVSLSERGFKLPPCLILMISSGSHNSSIGENAKKLFPETNFAEIIANLHHNATKGVRRVDNAKFKNLKLSYLALFIQICNCFP